jgi:hypothetical protein
MEVSMKKTILFLCVWFVLLGVVGAAKAILYTTADDSDHIFAPEFNNDKFWRGMEMDLTGHGALRNDGTALWDEGPRYQRRLSKGWRGLSKFKHQFGNIAGWPDYPSNEDTAGAGVPDLGTDLDPNWVVDIADYINETPPADINLNPTPTSQAPAPVPEPATLMLVGAGLVGIAALKRKKLSQSK